MTEQQRKAIEILNGIKNEQKLDGEQVISDDDYFFLLSFIIDKPQEITVAPYPVIQPFQPLTPYYEQRWEVTCTVDDNVQRSEKQGESIDKIAERARTEKQRVLVTESDGVANIDWDTRSIQDVKRLLEYGLGYIKKFEKQGENSPILINSSNIGKNEQKPVDMVESRFKVGDWVVFNNKHQSIYQVEKIEDGYYILRHTHGGTFRVCVLHDESLRLWTIQDAKDGDVLVYGDNPNDHHVEVIMIFKSLRNKQSVFNHFHIFDDEFRIDDWSDCGKNVHPATKEQRDLLFQKMKEAGYEWDELNRKVKKIEDEPNVCEGCNNAKGCVACVDGSEWAHIEEQNPAWSEEDIFKVQRTCKYLDEVKKYCVDITEVRECMDWLKSLEDRMQPQNAWKPSKEQIIALRWILNNIPYCKHKEEISGLLDQINKLREDL